MDTVAVISASGKRLMPVNSYKARKLLNEGLRIYHETYKNTAA